MSFPTEIAFYLPSAVKQKLISLRAGTPQFDEEQQQICARLRNIYQIPIFRPAMQDFFKAVT